MTGRRKYETRDGTLVPGVTTVIGGSLGWNKPMLMGWANKLGKAGLGHTKEGRKAATIGTCMHAMIEAHLRGAETEPDLSGFDDETVNAAVVCFDAFVRWFEIAGIRPIEIEAELISEELRCGGTVDCIADADGGLACIDWKSSKGIYSDHVIQVATYKALWEEVHPSRKIESVWIHRFGKDGIHEPRRLAASELADGLDAFKALRRLHELKGRMEG